MKFRVIKTVKNSDARLKYIGETESVDDTETENDLICLFPEIEYQEINGFGGAFTEAAAVTYHKLGEKNKKKFMNAYFDPENGIKYNFCRTHINSCDFSISNYTYVEDGDLTLDTFSIDHDRKFLIPMIKEAKKSGDFKLFASPWSPPPYMKSNGDMNYGGRLKEEYRELWSDYFVKYIEQYRSENISIWGVTVQNEPKAAQTWDSCVYSASEEAEFVSKYLGEKMKRIGVDIMFWDHNKERLVERSEAMFSDPSNKEYIYGAAFHWYSGDHFEQLEMFHRLYPDKKLIFSEGCQEYSLGKADPWYIGERYAHDIIGNFNNYCNAFCDWNILLDKTGGPNHVGNLCHAPIMADTDNDILYINASYYYIGHFSKYIKPNAKRIGCSKYSAEIETAAFKNTDGEIVLVIMNAKNTSKSLNIMLNAKCAKLEIEPHSIATILIDKK